MMDEKISYFEMTNFWALETITVYWNNSKIRMFQIKFCRTAGIQMDLLKNKHFSTEKAVSCIPCTEKGKKVPAYEVPEFSGSFSFSMLAILNKEAGLRILHHLSLSCVLGR